MKGSQSICAHAMTRKALLAISLVTLVACGGSGTSPVAIDDAGNASAVEQLVAGIPQQLPSTEVFNDERITEASGLQRSLQVDGVYYVHNDSGDEPTIYVVDSTGQSFGAITLTGNAAIDWEAIAGARLDGVPHLIVGDIGDNNRQRGSVQLYVLPEPDFDDLPIGFSLEVSSQKIDLSYADGASYDAEALFIDGDNDTVVVVTKDGQNPAVQGVWKGSLSTGMTDGTLVVENRGLVNLPSTPLVNAVTDIDIHPNGRELALLSYGSLSTGLVHIWVAREGEGTADALTREADRNIAVPFAGLNAQQAEGVSYSADGEHVLVAAEGRLPASTVSVISAN